ncbi:MAG: hypothetical protein ICV70_03925 [Jiangellaceae bacterium]|nr:hypothetical protein [Jiangellaceae bacterium]
MINVRHRRRVRVSRVLSYVVPIVTVALWIAAGSWAGAWVVLAAIGSVISYVLLAALIVWLDLRRWRDIAAVRKSLDAQHAAEVQRRVVEHRALTSYLAGLLDAAMEKVNVQRHVIALLRAEVNELRKAQLADRTAVPEATTEPPAERVQAA